LDSVTIVWMNPQNFTHGAGSYPDVVAAEQLDILLVFVGARMVLMVAL